MWNFYDLWIFLRCSRCWGQSQTQFQEEHLGTGTSQLLLISKTVIVLSHITFLLHMTLSIIQTKPKIEKQWSWTYCRESLRWRKKKSGKSGWGAVKSGVRRCHGGESLPSQGWGAAKLGVMCCQVRGEALPSWGWCAAKSGVRRCQVGGDARPSQEVRRGQVRVLGAAKSGVRRCQVRGEARPRRVWVMAKKWKRSR